MKRKMVLSVVSIVWSVLFVCSAPIQVLAQEERAEAPPQSTSMQQAAPTSEENSQPPASSSVAEEPAPSSQGEAVSEPPDSSVPVAEQSGPPDASSVPEEENSSVQSQPVVEEDEDAASRVLPEELPEADAQAPAVGNFLELKAALNGASGETTILVNANISLTEKLNIPVLANVTLASEGGPFTLTRSGFGGNMFMLGRTAFSATEAATLTLQNIILDGGGANGGNIAYSDGSIVFNNGTLILEQGAVLQNNYTANGSKSTGFYGGAVTNAGRLEIDGASIRGNHAMRGGGVTNYYSGINPMNPVIEMRSGTITGNTATGMTGQNPYTACGGGVYLESGRLDVKGGSIERNTAGSGNGGGVYVGRGDSKTVFFAMSGGRIADNTATLGGGVYTDCFGANNFTVMGITLSGDAVISGNGTARGSGIYMEYGNISASGSVQVGTSDSDNGILFPSGSNGVRIDAALSEGSRINVDYYQGGTREGWEIAHWNAEVTPGNISAFHYTPGGYITALNGSTKLCLYQQKPPLGTPGNLRATTPALGSIQLSWDAVAGAERYVVERAPSADGVYTMISDHDAIYNANPKFTDSDRGVHVFWYYRVSAYRTFGSTKEAGSATNVLKAKSVYAAPGALKAELSEGKQVRVSWSLAYDVVEVLRATNPAGPYAILGYTHANFWKDTTTQYGVTYYYKVGTYTTYKGAQVRSEDSMVAVVTTPPPVLFTRIDLGGATIMMDLEEEFELGIETAPANANVEIQWVSSNPAVVSVEDGWVTAHKRGKAVITASANGISSRLGIQVLQFVDSLYFTETRKVVEGEKPIQLKLRVKPANAEESVLWESDNLAVATVDERGRVTGHKEGVAVITAYSEYSGITAEHEIRVLAPVTSIKMSQPSASMVWYSRMTVDAVAYTRNGTKATLRWRSSNSKVATVYAGGTIITWKPGVTTITAESENGKKASMTLYVTQRYEVVELSSISMAGAPTDMLAGTTRQLQASYSPGNATGVCVKWRSSNASVLAVDAVGLLTAKKAGTAVITLFIGRQSTQVHIKVTEPAVKSVALRSAKIKLYKGEWYDLKPKVSPFGANTALKYKSSNTRVASVSAKGVIKAIKPGKASITVTAKNGRKATCAVTVVA